jgi:cytochrome c biogenesis protein
LDYLSSLWKLFTKIKLSIILLASIGTTSIIGTVIPQNESPADYLKTFGSFFYRFFVVLDFFDMYHSWWFRTLIVLLTVNIIVCSIDRLNSTWKIIFARVPHFSISRFKNLSEKKEFFDTRAPEQLLEDYMPVVTRGFGYKRVEKTDDGLCIFAEKGRWTRLGVYVVHFSVVLLLLGSLIVSIFGFQGYVNIPEGETVNSVQINNGIQSKPLDFTIRCDSFKVSYYESGSPKEYRSGLSILESGRVALKKDIIVNDPLRYKGINVFQSSFGKISPEKVKLKVLSNASGKEYIEEAAIGQPVDLPEEMGTFEVKNYQESANYNGQALGEAFTGVISARNQEPVEILLPVRFSTFDSMRKGPQVFSIEGYEDRYYTGLQVTKAPGVGVVYSGFILMIIGCFITFFMSHQMLCLEIVRRGKKSRIMIAGIADKNKYGMQTRIDKIYRKIRGQAGVEEDSRQGNLSN